MLPRRSLLRTVKAEREAHAYSRTRARRCALIDFYEPRSTGLARRVPQLADDMIPCSGTTRSKGSTTPSAPTKTDRAAAQPVRQRRPCAALVLETLLGSACSRSASVLIARAQALCRWPLSGRYPPDSPVPVCARLQPGPVAEIALVSPAGDASSRCAGSFGFAICDPSVLACAPANAALRSFRSSPSALRSTGRRRLRLPELRVQLPLPTRRLRQQLAAIGSSLRAMLKEGLALLLGASPWRRADPASTTLEPCRTTRGCHLVTHDRRGLKNR